MAKTDDARIFQALVLDGTIRPEPRPVVPRFLGGTIPSGGHPGLWWDRYGGPMATRARAKPGQPPPSSKFGADREAWVRELTSRCDKLDVAAMTAYAGRLAEIAAAAPNAVAVDAVLQSRLIIGMGLPSPVENSLQFHPTLGCPYIPGAALKGAAQAFADEWVDKAAPAGDDHEEILAVLDRIFGQPTRLAKGNHPEGATRLGSVVFFDAIPIPAVGEKVVIELETLTPHVGDPNAPYAETASPVPILFAAVAAGCRFRFTVAASRATPSAPSDVKLAAGWLLACLRHVGIGSKTKAGYGRFGSFISHEAWLDR